MMCNLLDNSGENLCDPSKCLKPSLCESEMSEMNRRVGEHACGEVSIYTSRLDREVLVRHHALGLPKAPRVPGPLTWVDGSSVLVEERITS